MVLGFDSSSPSFCRASGTDQIDSDGRCQRKKKVHPESPAERSRSHYTSYVGNDSSSAIEVSAAGTGGVGRV